jgi:hypothetical protein
MDKKKLAFYTRFSLLAFQRLGSVSAKMLTEAFLKEYPDFFRKGYQIGTMDASYLATKLFQQKNTDDENGVVPGKEAWESLFDKVVDDFEENKFKNEEKIPENIHVFEVNGVRHIVPGWLSSKTENYPYNWFTVAPKYSTPHMCPICKGTMKVPAGFYNSTSGFSTTNAADEPCRQCGATGILWSND